MLKEKKAARKMTVVTDAYTKTQLLSTIAENTGLDKKSVSAVIDEMSAIIECHLKKKGAGEFTMPGLLKIKTVKKPATKARKGTNPFTGEEMMFKAKPAKTVVKVQPLKALKDMAN